MRKVFFTALLLGLSLTFASSCGKGRKKDIPQPTDKVFTVSAAEVVAREIPDVLEISGTFSPTERLVFKSDFTGKVQALSVIEGQHVALGDALLKIEDEKLPYVLDRQRAELREAEAQYELNSRIAGTGEEAPPEPPEEPANPPAENPQQEENPPLAEGTSAPEAQDAPNGEDLAARRSFLRQAAMQRRAAMLAARQQPGAPSTPATNPEVTESRLSLDQARIDRIKAEIAISERQLAGSTLLATVDGFVAKVNVGEGSLVKGDEALLEIVKIDPIELILQVPSEDIQRLDKNMNIKVSAKNLGQESFSGEISYIGAEMNPAKKTLEVRVRVLNPGMRIKAGMDGVAHLAVANKTHSSLLIPPTAVRQEEGKNFVYVLEGQIAEKRLVETGITFEGLIEVKKGLKSGERVVTRGVEQLKEEEEFVKVAS